MVCHLDGALKVKKILLYYILEYHNHVLILVMFRQLFAVIPDDHMHVCHISILHGL
jgi:hypothetical protein